MKRKQRIIAIVLLCSAMLVMGIIQCFALDYPEFAEQTPTDLGSYAGTNTNLTQGVINKKYLAFNIKENGVGGSAYLTYFYLNENGIEENYQITYFLTRNNKEITIYTYDNKTNQKVLFLYPSFTVTLEEGKTYYIPVYTYNVTKIRFNVNISNTFITGIYNSTESNYDNIVTQAYKVGYNNGYNNGYKQGLIDYPELQDNINLVQHIEQLIAKFTGNEYAKYITPIALVLTILMIYFLFIRFLLSLMKAKGVIKTCDILIIVACIIVLVCMYMPMINLEITQHQIIEQVETTSSNVYQVNSDITYYTYTDNQGNTVHGGPGGTYIEYVETTTE